jgi:hypothetical protein
MNKTNPYRDALIDTFNLPPDVSDWELSVYANSYVGGALRIKVAFREIGKGIKETALARVFWRLMKHATRTLEKVLGDGNGKT